MSEETSRLVARLRTRLRRTSERITRAELAFGVAVALGAVAAVWLIATILEANLWLGTTARTAIAAAIGTLIIGVSATVLARPLGRLLGLLSNPSEENVARRVGKHYPGVADRLVNLLQLADGRRTHAPAPLVDQAVHNLAEDLDEVSFEAVEDFGRARSALRLASLPVAGLLVFLLVAPATFIGASERLLAPETEFERPAPFQLSVTPGDTHIIQGDSLQIQIRATGSPPDRMALQIRDSSGAPIDRRSLRADSAGLFQYMVGAKRNSFQYRVDASPIRTNWFNVTVTRRPLVQKLQVTVTPPAYTELPPRRLDPNVGDVNGLPGSRVEVRAAIGGTSVDTASLTFSDSTERPLNVEAGTVTGTFSLQREGTYQIHLRSPNGTTNRDPIQYRTSLQSDAPPSVAFLQPKGTTDLSADLTQQIRVTLSDDFGFSKAKLYYRVADQQDTSQEGDVSALSLPLPETDKTSAELAHKWLLAQESGLDPEPGEDVLYYVKVWDNDSVNGPKSSRTSTQRLRRPSRSQQYDDLDRTQQKAGSQLNELRERSDSVRQQFRQLRDELRRTREADWQERQQLDQIRKKQKAVDQGVEKLSETVRKMNRQMQQNSLSSPETRKKFQELQRVIEETKSSEMKKALDQLEEAMKQNNLRRMQQAMKKVQENEQSYQEQLERTLSLLEQLKVQQKLEEMAQRANELSEQEKKLRKKTRSRMKNSSDTQTDESEKNPEPDSSRASPDSATTQNETGSSKNQTSTGEETSDQSSQSPGENDEERRGSSSSDSTTINHSDASSPAPSQRAPSERSGQNEDLARQQEQAAKRMQKLLEEMDQASKQMEEVQSAPRQKMQRMRQQLKRENLPRQMRENSKRLRQNQLRDAQKQQRQMQQRLRRMQKQLSQMQNQMKGRQRQMNVSGLRSALENTLWLSKRQESLRTTVTELASQGPSVRSYARDQKVLSDGLTTVADSLQSLARRIPKMSQKVKKATGNALRAMETATTALDERDAGKATGHQKTSMMHLNKLALLLSDLLENMQQQNSSGSGMSKQQMMNQLRQMSGQQQKLNNQIQKHLKQMQGERLSKDQAQRQKKLAKQQRQIKQQLQEMDVGSDAQNQIMGDLKKIAKQMEETAQQLEKRRPSRDLIDRQQQILTRLLNAQQSLRTQGKKEQRRGRDAEDDYDQRRPEQLSAPNEADQLRQDLIRALEMGYNPDYETLIKRYFELLQKENATTP